jgi:hypothetical protein
MNRFALYWVLSTLILFTGCNISPWNNPYPDSQSKDNIYYDSFEERPKHLDPVSSYSGNEYVFLGQIYEPVLQYHFLKRPYELIPLTATAVPQAEYYDNAGNMLDADTPPESVHRAVYRITIKSGILYQPHPAFARDKRGKYRYHHLSKDDLEKIHALSDFSETGTRELTAEDYVYQIKRLAHPGVHSPIAGLMSKYIHGLQELSEELTNKHKK